MEKLGKGSIMKMEDESVEASKLNALRLYATERSTGRCGGYTHGTHDQNLWPGILQ